MHVMLTLERKGAAPFVATLSSERAASVAADLLHAANAGVGAALSIGEWRQELSVKECLEVGLMIASDALRADEIEQLARRASGWSPKSETVELRRDAEGNPVDAVRVPRY